MRREKIAKGLCYYGDQPCNREHKCQFRKPQLFTVEIPGDMDSDDEEEFDHVAESEFDPQITVHALAGNQSFHTMRVK